MLTSGLFSNWKLLEIADACEGVLGQDGVHPSL
jgi:hypothetical protein